MKDFKNKVVVITGGATGIGLSFAKQFGKEGAKIIIGGIEQDRNEEAVEILSKLGIEAKSKLCDVTQRKEVEALAEFAWEKFQNVDVIVNNAGTMSVRKNVIDSTPEDFLNIYNVNVFGVINGSSVFGKRFIMQGTPCAIYNIGSENSLFHGVPTGSAYVSSKHAVLAITESLKEEAPDFMDVGLICPGYVKSELGEKAAMQFAMDTDKFTSIAMQQIKDGKFYIVSHAYNMKRINKRYNEIKEAFEQYAPRYEGDEEFDIRTLMVKLMEHQPSWYQ
jgi:NAD(P)-dependent dehydrogenase (short-subunit alcohol dehydrogenase family)